MHSGPAYSNSVQTGRTNKKWANRPFTNCLTAHVQHAPQLDIVALAPQTLKVPDQRPTVAANCGQVHANPIWLGNQQTLSYFAVVVKLPQSVSL
jgi:hypothetical protein